MVATVLPRSLMANTEELLKSQAGSGPAGRVDGEGNSEPCPALSCPALPCPALLRPALPCPVLPCPALPCPALPCPALPCRALLCCGGGKPCPTLAPPLWRGAALSGEEATDYCSTCLVTCFDCSCVCLCVFVRGVCGTDGASGSHTLLPDPLITNGAGPQVRSGQVRTGPSDHHLRLEPDKVRSGRTEQ